ncbi:MAG TPA: SRPBCC family protein [Burkholderiales bacterium]
MNQTVTHRPVTLVEPGTVKLERLLPGPVERVWPYITDSDKRAQWLAAGEFELRVGGKVRLEFDNGRLPNETNLPARYKDLGKGRFEGVITRLEPPRLLAHTWKWDAGDTEVIYELAPRGKQVLLTIVHRRLTKALVMKVMGGWDVHSGILEDILNGVEPRPFWATHEKVAPEYAALAQ